ncbi:MAG: hypothetical protein K2P27_07270 [Lachnospiraceae bacterium]|nr:hypothetical protein [Lachnospiraceae bacterium]
MRKDLVRSGMEGLDKKLDYIRTGENVVFRVKKLEHVRLFSNHFIREQIHEGRKVIYLRYGREEALAEEQEGLVIQKADPRAGFELFTLEVQKIMEKAESGALFYSTVCQNFGMPGIRIL